MGWIIATHTSVFAQIGSRRRVSGLSEMEWSTQVVVSHRQSEMEKTTRASRRQPPFPSQILFSRRFLIHMPVELCFSVDHHVRSKSPSTCDSSGLPVEFNACT